MATPFPKPEEARKKKAGGARRSRATTALLATSPPVSLPTPVPHVSTKISVDQHAIPGPSGIKQCYRTVKSIRRIPILHNPNPSSPHTSASSAPSPSNPTPSKKQHQHACKQCHKKFNSPGKLSQHTLSHTGELPFTCPICDKKFNSKFKLVRHGLIHNETRPFSCSTCYKTFHRKDHLVNHERTHNPTKVPYKCDKEDCTKQYTSLLSFKKHLALHSAEEGNLECKICFKTFDNKADIVYHLKVHAGSRTVKNENDKKFKCTECERKFFTGKDVRRHLVVHTGSRDFPCQFCEQRFGRKDHLVRHMKKAHPNETLQHSTPGTSSIPIPPSVSKKGKGEGKKTKTKADVTTYPTGVEEISIKREQIPTAIETSGIFQFETQQHSTTTGLPKTIIDVPQQAMFVPCEEIVQIKSEPSTENIKIEESLIYETLPSTSKSVGPFMVPPTESRPSTSLGKFEEFPSGVLQYLMPQYPVIAPDVGITPQEELGFISRPESEMLPVLEADKSAINILEQSILIGEGEPEFSSQQQPQQPEQQKVVLPKFTDAFPSSAQAPKPPQHPPK